MNFPKLGRLTTIPAKGSLASRGTDFHVMLDLGADDSGNGEPDEDA